MGLEKKIEEAIRTTLVIENKDSVKYAIDKILKVVSSGKWISVKERMPKEEDEIIIVTNGNIKELVWYSEDEEELMKPWRYNKDDHPILRINDVKYWMPLPEIPDIEEITNNDI